MTLHGLFVNDDLSQNMIKHETNGETVVLCAINGNNVLNVMYYSILILQLTEIY